MSSLRPSRLFAVAAAAAACVITLAACGSDANPGTDPTPTETAEGQIGEPTTTPTDDATPTPTATTTTQGGGGGGGGGGGQYPGNAAEYGLAMLQAIASGNDTRIVDLSSLSTAQYVQGQNYKAKNGQWTNTHCELGVPNNCYYYNQTGDIAFVMMEGSKIGQKSAVLSVNIEGGSFATNAVGYAQNLANAWTFGYGYATMRSLATQSVVTFLNGAKMLNAGNGGVGAQAATCPAGQSGTCVEVYAVGGSLTISYIFVVDSSKLGRPNAVIAALPTP